MKRLLRPGTVAANVFRNPGIRGLVAGSLLAAGVAITGLALLHQAEKRDVLAQSLDLRAIAKHYPNFTRQQQMAILRAHQEMQHPKWRDLSFSQAAARLLRFAASSISAAGGAGSSANPVYASFSGNLTGILAPGADDFFIMRQSDCSLTLTTGTYNYTFGTTPTLAADGTSTHYDATLHSESGLSTTAGTFASGCADPTLGISTRRGMYLGKTSQNLPMFAAAGYYAPNGTNGIYYGTGNPSAATVSSFTIDTADPNVKSITAGDLNGDGLADIVAIDELSTTASVNVRLASLGGTIAAPVYYSVPGTTAEAATVDDVNGDGKADVIVASIDSSKQEYISVLLGRGDGTLAAAVSIMVATPAVPDTFSNQGYSTPPTPTTTAAPIVNLITGNIRGAGLKDIITSNGLVLLNNGSGTFTALPTRAFTPIFATSDYGPNLAVGNLNADTKQDIVVDNGSAISIYLSNGDGTFAPGRSYTSSGDVGYVTVTDLDGDGNADIYEGLANGGFFGGDQFSAAQGYVLMGNGDGTFRGAPFEPFLYAGSNLADLNKDGIPDAVGASTNPVTGAAALVSYLGNGNGTFTAASTLVVSPALVGAVPCYFSGFDSFALGDVNGDGYPDLVYIPEGCGGAFFVALGTHTGSFNAPQYVAAALPADTTITGIQTGDFNHDGRIDVAYSYSSGQFTSTTTGGFAVQLSNGDGTFQAPQLVQTALSTTSQSTAYSPFLEAIGDVNGDGFADVFTTQPIQPVCTANGCGAVTGYTFQYFLGKGNGTFQAAVTMPANPSDAATGLADPLEQVILADMNGDGHPDVVALGPFTVDGLAIYLGKGDGTFATPSVINYAGAGLAIADFNGDGKLDAYVAYALGSGIFYGNGDGTLQAITNSSYPSAQAGVLPSELVIFDDFFYPAFTADFNGDGKPDILTANTLLLSQAASTTTPTLTATGTTLTASPASVTAGQTVTLTAKVAPASGSGTPTGTVTFYDGSTALGTSNLASGSASFSTSTLTVGTHSITAMYSGDTSYSTSMSVASSVVVTASPIATTTALAASPATAVAGTSILFTATTTPGTATGTVTFYDGNTSIGTGTLTAGAATLTLTTLAAGSHSITAMYGGSAMDSSSTSTAVAVTITAVPVADFSVTLLPTSGTVMASSSVTTTVYIAALNGFNQAVTLTCAGAPANTTCTIAPGSVTPSGTTPATAILTVQANANAAGLSRPARPGGNGHSNALAVAGLTGLLTCAFRRKRLGKWSYGSLVVISVLLAGTFLNGCGHSQQITSSRVGGAYPLTITATAGATTHTATYNLTLQ